MLFDCKSSGEIGSCRIGTGINAEEEDGIRKADELLMIAVSPAGLAVVGGNTGAGMGRDWQTSILTDEPAVVITAPPDDGWKIAAAVVVAEEELAVAAAAEFAAYLSVCFDGLSSDDFCFLDMLNAVAGPFLFECLPSSSDTEREIK